MRIFALQTTNNVKQKNYSPSVSEVVAVETDCVDWSVTLFSSSETKNDKDYDADNLIIIPKNYLQLHRLRMILPSQQGLMAIFSHFFVS